MTTTTYYNLNIVEGTDIVNPLVVDNPNYQKIDETMHDNAVSGVTLATEIANATVHAITRENSECAVIRFIATSEWKAGDSATVDGVPVTALLPSGETLPDGAYVINSNVLCILTGTNLTIYAERKKTENANEIAYNDTTVGAELVKLDGEIVRLDGEINNVNSNLAWKETLNWSEVVANCKDSVHVLLRATIGGQDQEVDFIIPSIELKSRVLRIRNQGYELNPSTYGFYQILFDNEQISSNYYANGVAQAHTVMFVYR